MSLHISLGFSLFTFGMMLLVPVSLWLGARSTVSKLKMPDEKKRNILIIAGVVLFGWFLFSLFLALLDFYHVGENILSPLIPFAFLLPIIIGYTSLRSSSTLQQLLTAFPHHWLILVQIFRVLGIVFIMLWLQGLLPAAFAIPSGVGDMLVGGLAPVVAFYYLQKKPHYREVVKAWNYIGILDLIIAIGVGVFLALQVPLNVSLTTPSTEIMTIFPLAMIPVYAVPLGFVLHLFSLWKLQREKTN